MPPFFGWEKGSASILRRVAIHESESPSLHAFFGLDMTLALANAK
ncbi:hypothetical protein [Rudaea cellulosilytica]|nr:hypothetical protein [Rudaea cellulosilytica]